MTTTKLNTGHTVLAADTKYGVCAKTYANRTQAAKAAEKTGGQVMQIGFGRVFYVVFED